MYLEVYMTGTVKWFSGKKGYGFIADEKGNDLFVHFSNIKSNDGYKTLSQGDTVSFEVSKSKDGKLSATNVTKI